MYIRLVENTQNDNGPNRRLIVSYVSIYIIIHTYRTIESKRERERERERESRHGRGSNFPSVLLHVSFAVHERAHVDSSRQARNIRLVRLLLLRDILRLRFGKEIHDPRRARNFLLRRARRDTFANEFHRYMKNR